MKKYYISTPIYYVNGKPHLGHSYTTIAADVLARYYRSKNREVFFLTGTDEHGSKIEEVAAANGVTPRQWSDGIIDDFKKLWARLDISYDDFIRTTDERHIKTVQEIFAKLLKQGDIYKGKYTGWYCVSCESFYTDSQIVDGNCPDCNKPVKQLEEESYFFKLTKYQNQLLEYYEKNPDFLQPAWRASEMINFVKDGLRDLSVSRTQVKWGITVPGDEAHTVYVWFDALINYVSASKGRDIWPCDIHLVGKEIFKFHTIIWPAMLMAYGLPLPKKVFAHGWWTVNGDKMSKSKNNFIDPHAFIDKFGSDAYRYFVFKQMPFGQDGDFSETTFLERYNSDLANNLGNLVSRSFSMLNKYSLNDIAPQADGETKLGKLIAELPQKFDAAMEKIEFHNCLALLWEIIDESNRTIDSEKPWSLFKTDKPKLAKVMANIFAAVAAVYGNIGCFMPQTAEKMKKIIAEKNVTEPLFPRIQQE